MHRLLFLVPAFALIAHHDGRLLFPSGESTVECSLRNPAGTECVAEFSCSPDPNDEHPSIYVINLRARSDRWQKFLSSWSYKPLIHRGLRQYRAVPHMNANGKVFNGCAASHIAVVEGHFSQCVDSNIVMVLEDDAVPSPDFDERFPAILKYALTHLDDWHIINLGSTRGVPSTNVADFDNRTAIYELRSQHLLRVSVWSGMHSLLVNRRALPAYARLKATYSQHDLSSPWAHNDYVLSHDEGLVTLAAVPSLVWQSSGYSNIRESGMDYSSLMSEADQDLLAARAALVLHPGWPALRVPRDGSSPEGEPYYGWKGNGASSLPLRARVLNLDHRPDRWNSICRAWSNFSTVQLHRFPATAHHRSPSGTHMIHGCASSHYFAVRSAFEADSTMEVVLIMEDDAVPRPNFDERFPAILEYALAHLDGWDIINLGTTSGFSSADPADADSRPNIFQLRSPSLLRSTSWLNTICVLVNRRAMKAYERMYQIIASIDMSDRMSQLDWYFSVQAEIITLVAAPALVWQAVGMADNPTWLNGTLLAPSHRDLTHLFINADAQLADVSRTLQVGGVSTVKILPSHHKRIPTVGIPYDTAAWLALNSHSAASGARLLQEAQRALLPTVCAVLVVADDDELQWQSTRQAWGDTGMEHIYKHICSGYRPGTLGSTTYPLGFSCYADAIDYAAAALVCGAFPFVLIGDAYSVPLASFATIIHGHFPLLQAVAPAAILLGTTTSSADWCLNSTTICSFERRSEHLIHMTNAGGPVVAAVLSRTPTATDSLSAAERRILENATCDCLVFSPMQTVLSAHLHPITDALALPDVARVAAATQMIDWILGG